MFIDSHAHIDGPEFDADREDVIERARTAGGAAILNVGTGDPHSGAFERAVKFSQNHEHIFTAIGTHPHDARFYDAKAETKIKTLLKSERVIAWGEIGLDFHYDNSPRDVQLSVFKQQLHAAYECEVPVVIHTREAELETIEILKTEYGEATRRGAFHCFSGSMDLAQSAIELGFMISFSGIVTFKKADELRAIAREVPLDRLLIETDCPYLTPIPYRGKRNEPSYVIEVARCLAALHDLEIEEMARITSENFSNLFRL
ncbi:MAG TPA: TatD family hydrolase [Pyrinomonadaceae bacterium]|nr:TatD family hydrolase [Pyrinomonadaceae bacterium]